MAIDGKLVLKTKEQDVPLERMFIFSHYFAHRYVILGHGKSRKRTNSLNVMTAALRSSPVKHLQLVYR